MPNGVFRMTKPRKHKLRLFAVIVLGLLSMTDAGGGAEPPPATSSAQSSERVAETSDRESPVARALRKPVSFVANFTNLETAMAEISKQIDVPIEIIGQDLQLKGITKSSVWSSVDIRDVAAGHALWICMRKMNSDGKLIYVVRSTGGQETPHSIVVTTRRGAAQRGEKAATEAMNVAESLRRKITLKIDRDNMEGCVKKLSELIQVPIEVLHTDMGNAGLVPYSGTVRLAEVDRPAGEILRKILKIKDKGDDSVVYLIKPKNPGEPDMIFITTRYAAQKRGDPIPAELQRAPRESAIERALQRPVTLKTDGSFGGVVYELSKQIDVPIEVINKDIANEGIVPQAHRIRLAVDNQPAGDVLLQMIRMLQRDRDDKVVYVIKPKNPGEPETIFITTRSSAAKRGDKVPAVFDKPAMEK
jgi:hypothetical protein